MPAEPNTDAEHLADALIGLGMYEAEHVNAILHDYHDNHGSRRQLARQSLIAFWAAHPPKPRIEPGNRS